MKNEERPFVDYYAKNKISPVSQDISDLNRHFTRREALCRHLGIPPLLLKEKRILEIGPGSGHNALFTLSCEPRTYDFVEGNPIGAKETLDRVESFRKQRNITTQIKMYHTLLEDFYPDEKYDVVFCEGLLPWQKDPSQMLRHIMNMVKSQGIVVITCIGAVSMLSDNLRRIMGHLLVNEDDTLLEQAKWLVPFFEQHFKNLHGMSRPVEDWILDNVLHIITGKLFSIGDACNAVNGIATVYNASQNFYQDWTWYKDVNFEKQNNSFINFWKMNIHNFLDYRHEFEKLDSDYNEELYRLCHAFALEIYHLQRMNERKNVQKMLDAFNNVRRHIKEKDFLSDISLALDDANKALLQVCEGNKNPNCGLFAKFFGKGQQYLSFIKK